MTRRSLFTGAFLSAATPRKPAAQIRWAPIPTTASAHLGAPIEDRTNGTVARLVWYQTEPSKPITICAFCEKNGDEINIRMVSRYRNKHAVMNCILKALSNTYPDSPCLTHFD